MKTLFFCFVPLVTWIWKWANDQTLRQILHCTFFSWLILSLTQNNGNGMSASLQLILFYLKKMGCVCTKKSIRIEGVNYAIVEHIGDGWVFSILWINGVGSNQNKGGFKANTKSVTNNFVIFYTLGQKFFWFDDFTWSKELSDRLTFLKQNFCHKKPKVPRH